MRCRRSLPQHAFAQSRCCICERSDGDGSASNIAQRKRESATRNCRECFSETFHSRSSGVKVMHLLKKHALQLSGKVLNVHRSPRCAVVCNQYATGTGSSTTRYCYCC